MATDGTALENFSNLLVKNNLPVNLRIPGKIEAEAFSFNQGLRLETTSDAGGGQDVGYTDPGDYLDYRINVLKTARYNMEVRVAALASAGIIQVQQLDDKGTLLNFCTINLPVTGGWQTWKSVVAEISLTEGISKLRVKILKTEFNMNWYKFSEKGQGIDDNKGHEFRVFPNPAQEKMTIELPATAGQKGLMMFRNLNGVVVKSMELAGSEEFGNIYIGELPKGFYFLEMEISGEIFRTKLIVQ
jgi:endoglucanase